MGKLSDIPVIEEKKSARQPRLSSDIAGKVTETLGTGANAKDSIVYYTIKWAFIAGTIISVCVMINYCVYRDKVSDFTDDVKKIWEMVVPIITLALGYLFGKSQK
ncbi:hypothetical protein FO440_15360 [Mucilaginibacter corticis]|uniref:Uncharacterized protein n=1 Tax=Mucilaginibacter corticis TaxID=2597670 RepID=A0A556MGT9_9SPHI|nr:hypothetical protein [Mucilaginibacter corticis]TSJ39141.1 hypothetical protein FO440_15360 [Mucilaginibacter corticis]